MLKKIFAGLFICAATVCAAGNSTDDALVPGYEFQNKVIRYDRNQKNCDSLPAGLEKDFACAAAAYYKGNFVKSLAAYKKLIGKDSSLDKSILSRIARSQFEDKQFAKARETLKLGDERFSKDDEWKEFADRIRLDLTLQESGIKPKAKADSIDVFLKNYGDDESVPRLRYKKGVLLEQAHWFKAAKKAYL